MKLWKRSLAMLMALVLCLTLLPVSALAEESPAEEPEIPAEEPVIEPEEPVIEPEEPVIEPEAAMEEPEADEPQDAAADAEAALRAANDAGSESYILTGTVTLSADLELRIGRLQIGDGETAASLVVPAGVTLRAVNSQGEECDSLITVAAPSSLLIEGSLILETGIELEHGALMELTGSLSVDSPLPFPIRARSAGTEVRGVPGVAYEVNSAAEMYTLFGREKSGDLPFTAIVMGDITLGLNDGLLIIPPHGSLVIQQGTLQLTNSARLLNFGTLSIREGGALLVKDYSMFAQLGEFQNDGRYENNSANLFAADEEQLHEAVAICEDTSYYWYRSIYLCGSVTVAEDLRIPESAALYSFRRSWGTYSYLPGGQDGLTVASGAVLTLEKGPYADKTRDAAFALSVAPGGTLINRGKLRMSAPLTVDGTLVNEGEILAYGGFTLGETGRVEGSPVVEAPEHAEVHSTEELLAAADARARTIWIAESFTLTQDVYSSYDSNFCIDAGVTLTVPDGVHLTVVETNSIQGTLLVQSGGVFTLAENPMGRGQPILSGKLLIEEGGVFENNGYPWVTVDSYQNNGALTGSNEPIYFAYSAEELYAIQHLPAYSLSIRGTIVLEEDVDLSNVGDITLNPYYPSGSTEVKSSITVRGCQLTLADFKGDLSRYGMYGSDGPWDTASIILTDGAALRLVPGKNNYGNELALTADENCLLINTGNSHVTLMEGSAMPKIRNFGTLYLNGQLYERMPGVIYQLDGGVNDPANPAYATGEAFPLLDPSRPGYRFLGWYSDAAFTHQVTEIPAALTADLTLYARWSPISYSIAFDPNGGTGTMKSLAAVYGRPLVLTACAFKRTGYRFADWNTAPDGSGVSYANKETVRSLCTVSGGTVTLYAQWEDTREYAVQFLPNGAQGSMDDANGFCRFGADYRFPACRFERPGFSFLGWGLSAKGPAAYQPGESFRDLAKKDGQTVKLYAIWEAHRYTVVFDGNGADSGTMKPLACLGGKTYTLTASAFKRTGYTFTGWNTQPDGSGLSYANKQKGSNFCLESGVTLTLYAQWEAVRYKITYKNVLPGDLNDNPAAYTVADAVALTEPVSPGRDFLGWFTDSGCKKPIASWAAGTTGARTLYAKWNTHSYSIAFDPNGGTGSMKTQAKRLCGKEYALPANSFKRAGYTFAGWAIEPDAAAPNYLNKAKVMNLGVLDGETVTLYAVWTPTVYKVTYKNLTAAAENPNPADYTVETGLSLAEPSQPGCDFLGWFTDSGCKKPAAAIDLGETGARTFYAKWNVHSYSIAFDGNGGTGTMKTQAKRLCNKEYALPANSFKRAYCSFTGWNTAPDGSGQSFANKEKVLALGTVDGSTVTLYAQWTPTPYTITYKNLGDYTYNPNPATYVFSESVELAVPEHYGYTFEGWFSDSGFKKPITTVNPTADKGGNVTVYAKWSKGTINIHFDSNAQGRGVVTGTMKSLLNRPTGVLVSLPANSFKLPGYRFLGWSGYPDSTTAGYPDKCKVMFDNRYDGADFTYYAVWEPIRYQISYRNVPTGWSAPVASYTVADEVALPIPRAEGMRFAGWYTSASFAAGTRRSAIHTGTMGDLTLYARWDLAASGDGSHSHEALR